MGVLQIGFWLGVVLGVAGLLVAAAANWRDGTAGLGWVLAIIGGLLALACWLEGV